MISVAEKSEGRYHITAYLMPAGYLKTARYISKDERIRCFAADDITKDEKSYHFSDNSSKDRGQTYRSAANALKAMPDARRISSKRAQPGSYCI